MIADNICLGVGSDESTDAIIRVTCVPAKEKILIMPQIYSMYSVCANINVIKVVERPLFVNDSSFQIDEIKTVEILNIYSLVKLTFITSPGS